jgi:hypothetical protein
VSKHEELITIHIVWEGPLTVEEAAAANTGDDYGLYQIYGTHDVSGPDTLLYIGQADRGTFDGRIAYHYAEWARWNPSAITIYHGQLAGEASVTNDAWGLLIDQAESVLIWKLGIPFNSARIKTHKYNKVPILVVNHGRRYRLPECVSTLSEFINSDQVGFKVFGPSGHPVAPPGPAPGNPAEEG